MEGWDWGLGWGGNIHRRFGWCVQDPFLEVVEGGALLLRQQATTEFASEKDDQAAAVVLSRLEVRLKGSRRAMAKLVVAQLPHLLEVRFLEASISLL